jgi:hypothetical protein
MKIGSFIVVFLSLLTCHSSEAQVPNTTAEPLGQAAEYRPKIVPVDFGLQNGPGNLGALLVREQETCITVQVPVDARLQAPLGAVDTRPRPDVAKLSLQVWLLKADGTVVLQQSADSAPSMIGNAGAENWFVMFRFTKLPVAEITGIVFRQAGKMYTQQIAATDWRSL